MELLVAGDNLESMGVRKCRRFKMGSDELTGGWRQFGRHGSQEMQEIQMGSDELTSWRQFRRFGSQEIQEIQDVIR
jgi:hypothetical protein